MLGLMVGLFLISGATALVGEVVWMRMLGLVLGNTVWAAAAAVTVWMAGMALGAHLGGRLAPRTARHLRWYGLAEAGIGLFYVFSPPLHQLLLRVGSTLGPDLGGAMASGIMQRFGLAVVALVGPTVLMGLTLPLLVERLRGSRLAGRVSLLYGINTLGAAAGVFVAAYLLLPRLGERGALSAAGLACALVGAVAILVEGHVRPAEGGPASASQLASSRGYLVLVGAMGMVALATELIWVRVLVLHLGSRVYAFAILLGVYLAGIALGSLVLWLLAGRVVDPRRVLAWLQLMVATALLAQLLALGHAGALLTGLPEVMGLPTSWAGVQGILLAAVAVLFLPVTVLYGASFPLAVAADPAQRSAGAHTGVVAAANTVGGIIGALAATFLLVPLLGCQRSLILLSLVSLAVAILLVRSRGLRMLAAAAGCAGLALMVILPGDWVLRRAGGGDHGHRTELVALAESVSATVLVKRHFERDVSWLSLELNGVNVAGSEPALLAVQQLQGHLPLLQVERPRRVLHVGFGSGGTCWAVSRYPVEHIDVVEIAPEVLRAADQHFSDINHHVLHDPRVNVIVNDGRNYLLATEATYDVILSDSIHPVYAGNSTLYTLEYFRLCRAHLNPGGVVSMWLPLYSLDQASYLKILAAFHEVFPQTTVWFDVSTVNEYTVVTGRLDPGAITIAWDRFSDPMLAPSLAIAGLHDPADLMADLLVGPVQVEGLVGEVQPHTDDLPFVEYTAGRILAREQTWRDNLLLVFAMRSRQCPFTDEPVPWAPVAERRDQAVRKILRTVSTLIGAPQSAPE